MGGGSGRKLHNEAAGGVGGKPTRVGGPPVQGLYDQPKSPARTSTPLYHGRNDCMAATCHWWTCICSVMRKWSLDQALGLGVPPVYVAPWCLVVVCCTSLSSVMSSFLVWLVYVSLQALQRGGS